MKKVLKFTATVAFMFVAAISMANEPELYLVPNEGAKSMIFKLDSPSEKTTLVLKDEQQEVIFSETLKKRVEYIKRFDLSLLDSGVYSMKVEDDLKVIRYEVVVTNESLSISDKKESPKPVFRIKGNKMYLNLLNLDREKVFIKVYDGDARLIFSEKLTDQMIIEKAFNFEKAHIDNYRVTVEDSKSIYSKSIRID